MQTGWLTTLLAPLVESAVGVDADADMIAAAKRLSLSNVQWRHLRAEELPADLGTFRLVTFAQAFHWMNQPHVAERVRGMIEPEGAWVHVRASTHRGETHGDDDELWARIDELVAHYLGPVRRAGAGVLPMEPAAARNWSCVMQVIPARSASRFPAAKSSNAAPTSS